MGAALHLFITNYILKRGKIRSFCNFNTRTYESHLIDIWVKGVN